MIQRTIRGPPNAQTGSTSNQLTPKAPYKPAPAKAGVKLLAQEGELYVLAQSRDRVAKERAIRRRQLKRLWARLKQLSAMEISREELLMKLSSGQVPQYC